MGSAIDGKVWASVSCFSPRPPFKTALLNRCRPPRASPTLRLWNPKSKAPISRLRVSYYGGIIITACLNHSESDNSPCLNRSESDNSASSSKEASFDIKLPRRSLMVNFTCNVCGERTQRTINRLAYERGTVFVQCAGCLVHHQLVDNLGLIVEYDLREDQDAESGTE